MKGRLRNFSARGKLKYISSSVISSPEGIFESQESYESLKNSIQHFGIIDPLIVRRKEDGYELICGAKRLKVATDCGIKFLPCLVLKLSNIEADEVRLAENMNRSGQSFVTTAQELKKLIYTYGLTLEETAELSGMSLSDVSELLHTLRLGDNMLTAIKKVGLTHRHAKALLRLSDDKVREAALCEMAYRNIDGDSADKYIDALLNHGEEAAVAPPRQIYVMKDVRLFLNSVEHGIEIMKNGGIDAQCFHVSDGEGVTLTIKIPCGTEKLTTV